MHADNLHTNKERPEKTRHISGGILGQGKQNHIRNKTMQMKSEAAKKSHAIKTAAVAIGVYGKGAKRLGDIAVTGKGLVWSNGASKSGKDVTVKWDAFINWMQSQTRPQVTTAKVAKVAKAAKSGKAKTAKPRAKSAANGARATAKAAPATKAAAKPAARANAKPAAKKAH
jgi:hypothetical protein